MCGGVHCGSESDAGGIDRHLDFTGGWEGMHELLNRPIFKASNHSLGFLPGRLLLLAKNISASSQSVSTEATGATSICAGRLAHQKHGDESPHLHVFTKPKHTVKDHSSGTINSWVTCQKWPTGLLLRVTYCYTMHFKRKKNGCRDE